MSKTLALILLRDLPQEYTQQFFSKFGDKQVYTEEALDWIGY